MYKLAVVVFWKKNWSGTQTGQVGTKRANILPFPGKILPISYEILKNTNEGGPVKFKEKAIFLTPHLRLTPSYFSLSFLLAHHKENCRWN